MLCIGQDYKLHICVNEYVVDDNIRMTLIGELLFHSQPP